MKGKLSYSNVVATLALFLALTGSSYAAVQLTRGSVKTKHLAAGSVTGAKVKNRSLAARDFRRNQLPTGPRGPAGPQGATGTQGVQGPPGVQGVPGPTQGSTTSGSPAADPSASFENTHVSASVTTSRPGPLFVYAKASLNVQCSAGSPRTGLYVDGAPVPGSAVTHASANEIFLWPAGVSAELPAGNHTVVLASDCPTGNWTGTTRNYQSISAVLLGGSL